MTGSPTSDISELCEFEWYQWVKFRDQVTLFPLEDEILGRCLCPAANIGPVMCMHILKANGNVVIRTTLRSLTQLELNSDHEKGRRIAFDKAISQVWLTGP
jgi:hypothetical protein